jgi:hypothetical protein
LDLLSNELKNSQGTEIGTEVDIHHTTPTAKKKRTAKKKQTAKKKGVAKKPRTPRKLSVPAPMPNPVDTATPGVPQRKCQGCVHCDLLELAALEPRYVPTYLKDNAFLELAMCAGECKKAIKDIYAAAPRDIIHYCDTGKKGYEAPDDDELKPPMECGLVLCLHCYEKRRLEYEMETRAEKGGRRIGRRSNKRK